MKATLAAALAAWTLAGCAGAATPEAEQPAPLLDLSGLAWLGGDRFLAVHDAKTPKEDDLPRVSILTLPASLDGVGRIDATPPFPEAPSSDLEAVARIADTNKLLLAESGDDAGPFDRIFLAEVRGDAVAILGTARWRDFTDYYNVEAMAVAVAVGAADGSSGVLLWAERNSGQDHTRLRWARLGLEPFRVEGPVGAVSFVLPASARDTAGGPLFNRAIVALDVDSEGWIYAASTLDPEGTAADPDNGPFRSIVYRIGRIDGGKPELQAQPEVLAVLDGLKVESLAVRETDGQRQVFVGTDDENHGGILRPLPAPRG
jgi:hypothetical protein